MRPVRGFGLPSAIFLLVILALLGAFMVSLSTTQNITSAQDVQGSKAYRAARAGIEWAAFNLKAPATACPAASTPLTIDSFSVTVDCSVTTHDEGGTTKYVFLVTSTATGGGAIGTLGRVERMISTFIEF
jgi:MSHA biogenesis protein MshP